MHLVVFRFCVGYCHPLFNPTWNKTFNIKTLLPLRVEGTEPNLGQTNLEHRRFTSLF